MSLKGYSGAKANEALGSLRSGGIAWAGMRNQRQARVRKPLIIKRISIRLFLGPNAVK